MRTPARDRLGPVADLARAGRAGQDLGADRRRLLAARVVVGDDDDVGLLDGDAAHDRPLAPVAIAAAAEHADEAAGGEGPQRIERRRERLGLVRVVDDGEAAALLADDLEPALHARQCCHGVDGRSRLGARGDGEAGRDERVLDLIGCPSNGKRSRNIAAVVTNDDALREAVAARAPTRRSASAGLAGRKQAEAARPAPRPSHPPRARRRH